MELARSEGLSVEMVIVGDDIAVDGGPVTGRRGLAGTVLVHKLAGAAAEGGASLPAVAAVARAAAGAVLTMGASLSTCRLPGRSASARLDGGGVELGLGIHGEPGCEVSARLPSADALAAQLVGALAGALAARALSGGLACLVNNLGGLSPLEMGVLARGVARALAAARGGAPARRLLCATLCTSTDARGASVSVLALEDEALRSACAAAGLRDPLEALDAPCPLTAWPPSAGARGGLRRESPPLPPAAAPGPPACAGALAPAAAGAPGAPIGEAGARALLAAASGAASSLEGARAELDALDALSGDGDAGCTASAIAGALAGSLPAGGSPAARALAGAPPAGALAALLSAGGAAVAAAAGGSSGVLYALMLCAGARGAAGAPAGGGWRAALGAALGAALAAARAAGGAAPGDRTLLDALEPLRAALARGEGPAGAAAAAAEGAAATADMRARAGRASYVPHDNTRGHPDPGAQGVAIWVRGAVAALAGAQAQGMQTTP